jgi:reverse gyrase
MVERIEFEELVEDLDNALGMIRDTQRQIDAQAVAMQIIVRTLDDRWPGMRRIICDDIWEAIRDTERRFALIKASHTPELIADNEEEIETLESLVAKIETDR